SASAAVSVRVRDGRLSTTDGPFAETKEHLSGFIIIEARDLNEAIRLAGNIPMARLGTIEVRPVRELERYTGEGARRAPTRQQSRTGWRPSTAATGGAYWRPSSACSATSTRPRRRLPTL